MSDVMALVLPRQLVGGVMACGAVTVYVHLLQSERDIGKLEALAIGTVSVLDAGRLT
jgi:hypothetical protein